MYGGKGRRVGAPPTHSLLELQQAQSRQNLRYGGGGRMGVSTDPGRLLPPAGRPSRRQVAASPARSSTSNLMLNTTSASPVASSYYGRLPSVTGVEPLTASRDLKKVVSSGYGQRPRRRKPSSTTATTTATTATTTTIAHTAMAAKPRLSRLPADDTGAVRRNPLVDNRSMTYTQQQQQQQQQQQYQHQYGHDIEQHTYAANRSPVRLAEGVRATGPIPQTFRHTRLISGPRGAIGLRNLGNTCYMSCIVQCLSHCVPMTTYFLHGMHRRAAELANARPDLRRLVLEYGELLDLLWNEHQTARFISPLFFRRAFNRISPSLAGYGQEDCQEFFSTLVDSLHMGLCVPEPEPVNEDAASGASKGTSPLQQQQKQQQPSPVPRQQVRRSSNWLASSSSESSLSSSQADAAEEAALERQRAMTEDDFHAKNPAEVANEVWVEFLRRNRSFMTHLFGGQLCSTVTCRYCGNSSRVHSHFWDLSLPLPRLTPGQRRLSDMPCHLRDCLDAYFAQEVLDGENAFKCETCQTKRACTKQLSLTRAPQLLVLHLKRFSFTRVARFKLGTVVDYPVRGLIVAGACYDLSAVACHAGGLGGGHYTARCRNPDTGVWHRFDDTKVAPAAGGAKAGSEAYLLFYCRRDQQGTDG
eukprot:UC1_evm3s2103